MASVIAMAVLMQSQSAAPVYSPAALKDQITWLPGAPPVGFRMFSGYVDVSPASDGSRQMFYWFVESQSSPTEDPLFLWTNGGPGCSGLGGFLTEQGPFRPGPDGKNLTFNPYAWNKVVNMVFIEQPVGVGFSVATGSIDYGDDQAATDNYKFIKVFLEKFDTYSSNDFYISSESYGGHYMPTLAKKLVVNGGVNFKGVALGNPLTYMPYRDYGQYGTAYGHQLLPKPLWDSYINANCKTGWPHSATCGAITGQMDTILAGFDGYALDFPVCEDQGLAPGRAERFQLMSTLRAAGNSLGGYFPADYEPCAMDWGSDYLNRADVKEAIHVSSKAAPWSMCANIAYNSTDVNAPMMPVWSWLVNNAELNIMIYSGDDDSVCATMGTQQFVWDLGLSPKQGKSWVPWKVDGQVAGFLTNFEKGFNLATVHGAGHMVPQTRPAQALELIKSFLAGW